MMGLLIRRRRRICGHLGVLCATLAVVACGAPPPQAPASQAKQVATALTTIIDACGQSDQRQPFAARSDRRSLEATAASAARTLATVTARDPSWIYQGQSLRQISQLSVQYLDRCGLPGASSPDSRRAPT